MWRKESGLMDFQKEVIDCKNNFIILNWCRNASKTFTLAKLIENKKPKNVIYVGAYEDALYNFENKIITFTKLEEDYSNDELHYIRCNSINGEIINIYDSYYENLNKDIVYDYLIFDDLLPYNLNIKANNVISTISYNNYDKWIQRFYPTSKVFEKNSDELIELGLLNNSIISVYEINPIKYYNEYAILDNPYNRKINKVALAYSSNRNNLGDISEMIIDYDEEKGYTGHIINWTCGFRTSDDIKIKIEEKVDYLKNRLLYNNGVRAKDYENIDKVMIDMGTGGGGIIISDILLSDWLDNENIKHNGLIDKSHDLYKEIENNFPNALDKLKLINSAKYFKQMQKELLELVKDGILQFEGIQKDIQKYRNDIENNICVLILAHRLYELRLDKEVSL